MTLFLKIIARKEVEEVSGAIDDSFDSIMTY